MAQVSINTVLQLRDFGLERLDEDKAIVGFGSGGRRIRNLLHLRPRPVVLLSALVSDRAPMRRISRRRVSISHESL